MIRPAGLSERVVCKLLTGMVQLSGSVRFDKRGDSVNWIGKKSQLRISLWSCFMGLLVCAGLFRLLAQESSDPSKSPDQLTFDFSVYFTGNVRANLEPCG
jgi:hypothetical protein